MSRHIYKGTFTDGNGIVIAEGTITTYLAGGTTAADVYAASSGGTAVNSVESGTDGTFTFYVDDTEYTPQQLFKIVLSKTNYTDQTFDNIRIIPQEAYRYFIDPSATDQGAASTGGDRTIKDFIDSIGATKKATLVLAHNGSTTTTTYTVTTAEVAGANIYFDIQPGAILTGTLTVHSPEHILASPKQKIFSGAGLTFTYGGTVHVGWWQDETLDGTNDYATAIGYAETAAATGLGEGIVKFATGKYLISSSISKSRKTSWLGNPGRARGTTGTVDPSTYGGTQLMVGVDDAIIDMTSGTTGSAAYCGNHYIKNIHILGNRTSYATASAGIKLTDMRQFVIEDVYITGMYRGISTTRCGELFVNRVFISGCDIACTNTQLADSWWTNSQFQGKNSGEAFRIYGAGNQQFTNCRFQTTEGGYGFMARNLFRAKFLGCIFDQNEKHGLYILNSQYLDIIGCDFFDNGTTSTNYAGIYIHATSNDIASVDTTNNYFTYSSEHNWYPGVQVEVASTGDVPAGLSASTEYYVYRYSTTNIGFSTNDSKYRAGTLVDITDAGSGTISVLGICKNIRIIGGMSHDRNHEDAEEVQDDGVRFAVSDSGIIRDIYIDGMDFKDIATPIDGDENITSNLYVTNINNYEVVTGTVTLDMWGTSYLDSSGGAVTATLPDGIAHGQRKVVGMSDASASSTLSVTSHETSDPEVFTFDATTDILILEWDVNSAVWRTMKNAGVAV